FQLLPEKRLAELLADLFGLHLATATIASMSQSCAARLQGFAPGRARSCGGGAGEISRQGNGNTDFRNSAARGAFCAVANMIAETPREPLTMANVLRVFLRSNASQWMTRQIEG